MQCPTISDFDTLVEAEPFPHVDTKPRLESHDSAYEFSLEHLLELHRLLKMEDYEPDGYVFDDTCLHAA